MNNIDYECDFENIWSIEEFPSSLPSHFCHDDDARTISGGALKKPIQSPVELWKASKSKSVQVDTFLLDEDDEFARKLVTLAIQVLQLSLMIILVLAILSYMGQQLKYNQRKASIDFLPYYPTMEYPHPANDIHASSERESTTKWNWNWMYIINHEKFQLKANVRKSKDIIENISRDILQKLKQVWRNWERKAAGFIETLHNYFSQ